MKVNSTTSVVLGTDVLVEAASRPDTSSGELFEEWIRRREFDVVTSAAVVAELGQCLNRAIGRGVLDWEPEELERWLAAFDFLSHRCELPQDRASMRREVEASDGAEAALVEAVTATGDAERTLVVTKSEELSRLAARSGLQALSPRGLLDLRRVASLTASSPSPGS